MTTYILRRVLLMIPTLFGVSFVVWGVLAAAPEPALAAQVPSTGEGGGGREGASVEKSVKIFRAQFGLDRPAVLNFYYSLEPGKVGAAVAAASSRDAERPLKERTAAQERLIRWGWYAVPALMENLPKSEGRQRDDLMRWLVRSAERVALGADTGRLDDATVRNNALVVAEGKMLAAFAWRTGDPEERKLAGVRAFERWFRGVRGQHGKGAPVDAVRAALAGGGLDALGAEAVPGLVRIVLDDADLRDAALPHLVRLARRPPTPGDPVESEARRLEAVALDELGWTPDVAPARKLAGVDLVRNWWEGAQRQWDTSGFGWMRVLFLETQLAKYWGNLLRFDLGYSNVHKVPVITLVLERLKYSLTLAVTSLVLAYLISVPLGVLSARIHGTTPERAIGVGLFALYSLPSFFVATLLVRLLAKGQPGSLEWIPDGQFASIGSWRLGSLEQLRDIAWHVVTPIVCLTYGSLAALSRYAKSGVLNVIRSDYVRTARAKGLNEFVITAKHAARPGIIPVVTLLGATLPVVVGGSFIIESIFSIPGFGLLSIQSIFAQDYNVIIGTTLIVAILTMVGILLSDILYAIVDPRISY